MTASPFRRLLVVNSSPEPDMHLLRYAAMLGSGSERPELMIATPGGETAMRYLAPWSRCAVVGHPNVELSFRVMLEPHLDLLFDMAGESQCDLIVARHPRHLDHSRTLLTQLLFNAPCAVCLLPGKERPILRRPIVRIELTSKGRELLTRAAAFAKQMGSDELLAAYTYFRDGFDNLPHSLVKLREQRQLELYRFLSRCNLSGVNCTPIMEESSKQAETLLRVAAQRDADMIIIDPDVDEAPSWQWNHREAEALASAAGIPLLASRIAPRKGIMGLLRDQVFTAREPAFN
jgi:hypothetical protein